MIAMFLIRSLLAIGFILIATSGCNYFSKPSEQDNTTGAVGSNVWSNNRMNQEEGGILSS